MLYGVWFNQTASCALPIEKSTSITCLLWNFLFTECFPSKRLVNKTGSIYILSKYSFLMIQSIRQVAIHLERPFSSFFFYLLSFSNNFRFFAKHVGVWNNFSLSIFNRTSMSMLIYLLACNQMQIVRSLSKVQIDLFVFALVC